DELRTGDDRDHERDERGDQDSRHRTAAPASASATTSSPTAREPFTSTAWPGPSSSSRRRSTALAASGAQSVIEATPSTRYSRASSPTATSANGSTPA